MEKRGVIERGRTPEDGKPLTRTPPTEDEKQAGTPQVDDDHLTNRAADHLKRQLN
jgi:hypothetical protein